MFPWEGPPLPRLLQITWVQLFGQRFPQLQQPTEFIKSIEDKVSQSPLATYSNKEEWEVEWDKESGLPNKITVRRHATKNG